jgi:hypothetical protein
MAVISTYLCVSCNTDLGAGGAVVESHLMSNPTHVVREILYDDSQTVDTVEGRVITYNNEPYAYDTYRSRWLSVMRDYIFWGIPATGQRNVYLRLNGVMTPTSSAFGYSVRANSTITDMVATASAAVARDSTFGIRIYGGANLQTIYIPVGYTSWTYAPPAFDVAAGTNLSCYLSSSNPGPSYPQLVAEIARRI